MLHLIISIIIEGSFKLIICKSVWKEGYVNSRGINWYGTDKGIGVKINSSARQRSNVFVCIDIVCMQNIGARAAGQYS